MLAREYQKTIWDDPLYQALGATTLYVIPLSVVPLVLRRRSAVAQHPLIYGCFPAMIPLWWGVTAGAYGDAFRTWQYLGSGVVAFATVTAVAVWIHRLRARDGAAEPRAGATHEAGREHERWTVTAPVSHRGRSGPKPRLTQDEILDVALAIMDSGGSDALSLRRLVDELGVTARPLLLAAYETALGPQLLQECGAMVSAADSEDVAKRIANFLSRRRSSPAAATH